MRALFIGVVLSVTVAGPASAQSAGCGPGETVIGCLNRLGDKGKTPTAAETDTTKKTETGLADLPNGLSSSTKDLLPLLQISGVLGPFERDAKTGVVTVDLNSALGGVQKKAQLRALINSQPTLFQPLKESTAKANKDLATALDKAVSDGTNRQDVKIEISYGLTSGYWGRDFSQHRDTIDALFSEATDAAANKIVSALKAANKALGDLLTAHAFNRTTTKFNEMGAARTDIEAAVLALAKVQSDSEAELNAAIKATGLTLWGQLVNNQPQLIATASRGWRDPLLGPNGVMTVRVAFESGLDNTLNKFFGRMSEYSCRKKPAECLAAYSDFVQELGAARIKSGGRLAASLELTILPNDYAPTFDGKPIGFTLNKGTVVSGGLTWGRLLEVDDDGTAGGRVDAAIKFDWHGNTDAQNRTTASITLTKKLGGISVPIGLVYANRTAFLSKGDYDHGITAHVGLKFNLFNGLK